METPLFEQLFEDLTWNLNRCKMPVRLEIIEQQYGRFLLLKGRAYADLRRINNKSDDDVIKIAEQMIEHFLKSENYAKAV